MYTVFYCLEVIQHARAQAGLCYDLTIGRLHYDFKLAITSCVRALRVRA